MPNSSSSKYVKRHRHRRRHTKSRRHAKKYTIKKVMRGCSSKQVGGATAPLGSSSAGGAELSVPPGTGGAHLDNLKAGASNLLKIAALNNVSGGSPNAFTQITPLHTSTQNSATPSTTKSNVQGGGYKSKHRRHRYKKSIGRRGRSRRFRGSRK
jgi:hypothetical protein